MTGKRTWTPIVLAILACSGYVPALEAAAPPPRTRFPLLGNDDAWRRLPYQNPPLPAWARTLAGALPRATAGMLELDHVHRARNPLGPLLRGRLRWAVADENRCDYARRYAEADLRRAGMGEEEVKKLAADSDPLLVFARKLTRAASTVTDEEVAALLKRHGPEKVVAIVHTVAYANFQDRVLLALRVQVEPSGPLPPLEVRLDRASTKRAARPLRWPWEGLPAVRGDVPVAPPGWAGDGAAELRQSLDRQKGRKPRIGLPDATKLSKLPPEVKARMGRIVWSNVSMGYQPMLTQAWFECMSAFTQEAQLDRVLANSMFWVITRSTECFY
jgi:alkylhydroperoxidase family enzyme